MVSIQCIGRRRLLAGRLSGADSDPAEWRTPAARRLHRRSPGCRTPRRRTTQAGTGQAARASSVSKGGLPARACPGHAGVSPRRRGSSSGRYLVRCRRRPSGRARPRPPGRCRCATIRGDSPQALSGRRGWAVFFQEELPRSAPPSVAASEEARSIDRQHAERCRGRGTSRFGDAEFAVQERVAGAAGMDDQDMGLRQRLGAVHRLAAVIVHLSIRFSP